MKFNEIGISPREATALKNVNLSQKRLSTRNGSALFSASQFVESAVGKPVTGIYQCILGGTTYRIATAGTKVYSLGPSGAKTDITGAATLTDGQNNLFNFASFVDNSNNDIAILSNGVDAPLKWTGAGNVAALSGVPGNFKFLLVKGNRLWATIGDFLYHTDRLKGETYDSLNWIQRFKTAGFNTSDITALTKFGDGIFISKEDAIYLFSGESIPTGSVQEVLTGDGVGAGQSVVEIPSTRYGNILAFYNKDGYLVGFNGTKNLIPLGEHIDTLLDGYNKTRTPYIKAIAYKKLNQYISAVTSSAGGGKNDKLITHDYYLDGVDQQATDRESTITMHDCQYNYLAIMNFNNVPTPFAGTYDGWVLRLDTGSKDVTKAAEIAAAPTGCSRSSNVVTITTLAAHNFSIGETVVISGTSGGFDGTFTVASTPTTTTFTYTQTGANTTGGAGIARIEVNIDSFWQSRKEDFGDSSHTKQINDFDIVSANPSPGSIKIDVSTDQSQASGTKTLALSTSATIYGPPSVYGQCKYGGSGLSYNRVVFTTASGMEGLTSRYFQFRLSGVAGFKFGIDEMVIGITDHGYQPQNVDTA